MVAAAGMADDEEGWASGPGWLPARGWNGAGAIALSTSVAAGEGRTSECLFYFYFLPEFDMKDIKVGSGSIIGKENIEEVFNHINSLYDLNEKSLVELTHDYEAAVVSMVQKLEARFINLHPTI